MRLFSRLLVAASFSLMAAGASATPDNPQSGKDYITLAKPQQTDAGNKVEVLEFFWYNCPHCNAFEPSLNDWVKKQGDKIVLKRVPVSFRPSFEPQQRLYYALEAMGIVDDMQKKIFRTIHVERKPLDTEAQIVEFITKEGIDKQKFMSHYNSFSMAAKVKRAIQLQADYQIQGVPTLAVAGRYVTAPSIISEANGRQPEPILYANTLKVMDWLVDKAAKPAAAQK